MDRQQRRPADPVWREESVGREHLAEEAQGCLHVTIGHEQEVNGRAISVDGSVQVASLTADLEGDDVKDLRPPPQQSGRLIGCG